jgi:thiol-disulfide isomerase/thioredoxin
MIIYIAVKMLKETDIETFKSKVKSGAPVIVFFHMTGCGHCEEMQPEWIKLQQSEMMKNKGVHVASIERQQMDKLKMDPDIKSIVAGVDGFPTIKFIKGKNVYTYEGDRKIDAFVSWVNKLTSSKGGRRRTHRKRTHRKRTHRKRTHRKRTHRKRTHRKRTHY